MSTRDDERVVHVTLKKSLADDARKSIYLLPETWTLIDAYAGAHGLARSSAVRALVLQVLRPGTTHAEERDVDQIVDDVFGLGDERFDELLDRMTVEGHRRLAAKLARQLGCK